MLHSHAAMKQARMRPTTRSYNALLSACERAGQPDRALEVWANMRRARRSGDAQLQPTAVTYNTLLSTCGKAGRCAAHAPTACAGVSQAHPRSPAHGAAPTRVCCAGVSCIGCGAAGTRRPWGCTGTCGARGCTPTPTR